MISTERRTRLLALMAKIDQEIAEAALLAANQRIRHREREKAKAWLSFHKRALKRVEVMQRDC